MQTSENTSKITVKRKRVYHLIPELRNRVPEMFDRMTEDKVAEQLGIPVRDVVAEAVRDLRRQLLRKPPGVARLVIAGRERNVA